MGQNKKGLLFERINKLNEVVSTLSENFSQGDGCSQNQLFCR